MLIRIIILFVLIGINGILSSSEIALSDYIKDFVTENPIDYIDYYEEARIVDETWELKTKLQDCLIVLPKVYDNIDLILMIKDRLNRIKEDELEGVI